VIRSVIGVSAYAEQARWAAWDVPASVVPQRYLDKVLAAGGVPVILPAVADISGALPRLELGLPVLGICRGLQLLNVALGGTLHQHVPDVVGHGGHSGGEGTFARHDVHLRAGSGLARALNRTTLDVPSLHHQAIDRLGTGLMATAWSDDGLIEAAELDGHPFTVGVQWHPEADEDVALFAALVAAADTAVVH
jgi:putative glutamine amidotransferase